MNKLHDFPPKILKPHLVRQHELLSTIQRRQAGELVVAGFATRFYQSLDPESQRRYGTEPYIKITRTTGGPERENFWLNFYNPGSWGRGGDSIFDLIAARIGGQLIPELMYEDLPYRKVAEFSDQIRSLVQEGSLSDVDDNDFEVNW